jgi:hypothetical protein
MYAIRSAGLRVRIDLLRIQIPWLSMMLRCKKYVKFANTKQIGLLHMRIGLSLLK